ncbi:MAG: hypothetical protein LUC93_17120 [Planctomycetaceae bacterium]|nr:hypothetical protein [Planctomycetaceae bacterium]
MTAMRSKYANILNENKILYMPSCLVVEMMTKLYSQVSMINLSNSIHNVMPDLLILLQRLTHNLRTTATAYREERIRFFIGDWKTDKLRARKLFFNLMSRLGYMCQLLGPVDKNLLYKAIEEMSSEWRALDVIMERKCEASRCLYDCASCRYFRSDSVDNWQAVMAKTILELDEEANYPDDETYLVLLCYERIRASVLNAIHTLLRRTSGIRQFEANRILYVSNEDLPITCPKCGRMTDILRRGTTEIFRKDYANSMPEARQQHSEREDPAATPQGRCPMPPSLAGIAK